MKACNTCNGTMDLIMEGECGNWYDTVYWCPHCGTMRTSRTDGYAERKVQYQTPATLSEALKVPGSNPNHQESNE